jgi:predicted Zn-dependent protease
VQIVARKEATTAQKAVALDQLARDAGFIGQEGRALKARKALVALAPANMTAQEELGKSLLVTGKLAEAVDMLTAAAAVDPSNAFIQARPSALRVDGSF